MARPPRRHRQVAVVTALQGGRPQRGVVRRLLQSAAALGGGAIHLLLRCPLRHIWRLIRSRIGRRPCVAARMAQNTWRNDEPARGPLLRRAVARARGAIQAILVPGSRALAFLRDLPQRALAFAVDILQRLVPDFLRRQLHPRPQTLLPLPPSPPPTPTLTPTKTKTKTKTKTNAFAIMYDNPPHGQTSQSQTPPPPPPLIVGGEEVSEEVQQRYAEYCMLASTCSRDRIACHFCFFEEKKSEDCTVRTAFLFKHWGKHDCDRPFVRCGEAGCRIRARPGADLARHKHFCH